MIAEHLGTAARSQPRRRLLNRTQTGTLLRGLAMAVYVVVAVFPFYWMFLTTFKTNNDLYTLANNPLIFNEPPTLDHIFYLFEKTKFIKGDAPCIGMSSVSLLVSLPMSSNAIQALVDYPSLNVSCAGWMGNSMIIGVLVVLITLAVATPAGYALARLNLPGANQLGMLIFATYLVPPTLLFIPLTRVVFNMGLQNTIWSLVVVLPTISIPFATWLLMGFFKNVPREIEEAALVDGCNRTQAVTKVVLPISRAGLAAAGMFAFAISLQAFLYPLVFTSSTGVKPVTLGVVTDLIRGDIYYWGELMAGALIAGLPVAILFNYFLDDFVEGITGGAFK